MDLAGALKKQRRYLHMTTVCSHIRSLVTPEGAVILDSKENVVITIDAIGGYIWAKLQAGVPVDKIVQDLACETGADVLTVERDVQEFLDNLTKRNLFARPMF